MSAHAQTIPERIAVLEEQAEQCAASRSDVEERLRKIERNQWFAAGAIAALQVILKFI